MNSKKVSLSNIFRITLTQARFEIAYANEWSMWRPLNFKLSYFDHLTLTNNLYQLMKDLITLISVESNLFLKNFDLNNR